MGTYRSRKKLFLKREFTHFLTACSQSCVAHSPCVPHEIIVSASFQKVEHANTWSGSIACYDRNLLSCTAQSQLRYCSF